MLAASITCEVLWGASSAGTLLIVSDVSTVYFLLPSSLWLGVALKSATQSSNFILVARVVTGLETGGQWLEDADQSPIADGWTHSFNRHHTSVDV